MNESPAVEVPLSPEIALHARPRSRLHATVMTPSLAAFVGRSKVVGRFVKPPGIQTQRELFFSGLYSFGSSQPDDPQTTERK